MCFQVVGRKHLVLFTEDQTPYLYAHEEGILTNTSQIDFEAPFNEIKTKFPEFSKARGYQCIMEPGDLLYIPPKCWHFVTSLETSFSISFWFQ